MFFLPHCVRQADSSKGVALDEQQIANMQILIADDHALVRDGLKLVLQHFAVDGDLVFF